MREISASRFSELVRAWFDIADTRTIELEELIRAAVIIENDRPEMSFTKGERRWGTIGLSQAGVVGQLSFTGWAMPRTSRVLAVVTLVVNSSGGLCDLICGVTPPATDLIAGEIQRTPVVAAMDSRLMTDAFAGGISLNNVRGASVGGAGGGVFISHHTLNSFASTQAGQTPEVYRVVLAPGGFLVVQSQVANSAVSANAFGYERNLVKGVRA